MNPNIATFWGQYFPGEWGSASVIILFLVASFIIVNIAALIGGLGTYAERKISADMQGRIGPNRVGPYGILQFLADGIKMLFKEDLVPQNADKFLYLLAPTLCIMGIFSTLAVFPLSEGFTLAHLDIGVFYLLGVSSIVGLGVFLGGYASNSKWSILGGMRGASQIVSYEIPVILSVVSVILVVGSMSFKNIIGFQSGLPHQWLLFHNPFLFIAFWVYFIAALAEANRAPFDLPEAESELVSGYHTEYSGMRFAFFALAEYVEVFILSGVCSALFLGGYQLPFHLDQKLSVDLGLPLLAQLLQLVVFLSKTFILYYFVIVVRWTLPRLRVDQLMTVCWKYLTPIALFNICGVLCWMYFFKEKSFYELFFVKDIVIGGGH